MKPRVLLLNLPAYAMVHRDVGCAYTSKSNYYYPQADLFMMGANVKKLAELFFFDGVLNKISEASLLQKIREINPNFIFTIVSSITEKNDLRILKKIKEELPLISIWSTGDLIFYTDQKFREIDVQVKDFTNSNEIKKAFQENQKNTIINVSGEKEFSVGIAPHEFSLDKRYHNPYSLNSPVAMILTNWGCPFKCTFCAARNLLGEEGKFKARNDDEVISEINYAVSLGFKEIYFRDFTFAIPRTERLLDKIIASGVKIKWSCATRVDMLNEKILSKMKKAGCYLIFNGVDGGTQEILDEIKKDVTLKEIEEKIYLVKKFGIETLCSFIVGFPNEDKIKTQKFIKKLNPDYLSVSILSPTYGSNLRKKTEIWEQTVLSENLNDSTFSDNSENVKFRNKLEREFYLRPIKLINYVRLAIRGPRRIKNFLKTGAGLISKWIFSSLGTKIVTGKRKAH